jgi:hypothetical protein
MEAEILLIKNKTPKAYSKVAELRKNSNDLPVFSCSSRRSDGCSSNLDSAFSVHIGAVLFSVCSSWKNDVGI